ncbi:hypothetical protein FHG87_011587 [Trinorchestia longiramus]|nr:hypothetical protein FHG87_011587 [Trinorchestia longiramus]
MSTRESTHGGPRPRVPPFHKLEKDVDVLHTELEELASLRGPDTQNEQELQDYGRAMKQSLVKLTKASEVLASRFISNGSTAAALETEKARMEGVRNVKNRLLILNTQLQALKLDTFSQPSRASGGTTSVTPSATDTQDLDLEDIPEHARQEENTEAKNRNSEEITSRESYKRTDTFVATLGRHQPVNPEDLPATTENESGPKVTAPAPIVAKMGSELKTAPHDPTTSVFPDTRTTATCHQPQCSTAPNVFKAVTPLFDGKVRFFNNRSSAIDHQLQQYRMGSHDAIVRRVFITALYINLKHIKVEHIQGGTFKHSTAITVLTANTSGRSRELIQGIASQLSGDLVTAFTTMWDALHTNCKKGSDLENAVHQDVVEIPQIKRKNDKVQLQELQSIVRTGINTNACTSELTYVDCLRGTNTLLNKLPVPLSRSWKYRRRCAWLDEECYMTVVDKMKNFLAHAWNKRH